MTKKTDKNDWTGAAVAAGAAIGSAAIAAAVLYATRRKDSTKTPPKDVPETD